MVLCRTSIELDPGQFPLKVPSRRIPELCHEIIEGNPLKVPEFHEGKFHEGISIFADDGQNPWSKSAPTHCPPHPSSHFCFRSCPNGWYNICQGTMIHCWFHEKPSENMWILSMYRTFLSQEICLHQGNYFFRANIWPELKGISENNKRQPGTVAV